MAMADASYTINCRTILAYASCSLRIKYKRSAILPAAKRRPAFNSLARTARVWCNLFGYKWGTNAHYWMPRRHITNTHMTDLFYFQTSYETVTGQRMTIYVFSFTVYHFTVYQMKSLRPRGITFNNTCVVQTPFHMNFLCSSEMR